MNDPGSKILPTLNWYVDCPSTKLTLNVNLLIMILVMVNASLESTDNVFPTMGIDCMNELMNYLFIISVRRRVV